MERGRTFEKAAEFYDAHRNGYPSRLFADLAAIAALEPGARVLEVGCGSGLATAGFVDLGLDVTAIDPGSAMIEIARRRFESSPAVRFAVTSFEDWPIEPGCFQLVAAAQSWHWVRPDVGFAKAAQALARGGRLAIFGHTSSWPADMTSRLRPVYLRHAPELWTPPAENWYLQDGPIPGLITMSGRFADVAHRSYSWRRTDTAASLAAHLGTRSNHLLLPSERRAALLAAVEAALPQRVETDWVTHSYVATVRKV